MTKGGGRRWVFATELTAIEVLFSEILEAFYVNGCPDLIMLDFVKGTQDCLPSVPDMEGMFD